MKNSYCVFLGDVAQDEYYTVKRFPGIADKVMTEMLESQMGGMIANAACVYASYGIPTKFLGCLNPRDKKLCTWLNEKAGIDTNLTVFDDSLPDSKCMIYLSEEEQEHTVFIVSMHINDVPINQETQDILKNASVIYAGYNNELLHLRSGNQTSLDLVREWYENGVKLVCDIDVDKINDITKKYLPYTHILFMNKVGFENNRGNKSGKETVDYFLDSGIKILIITLAEDGCIIYQKNKTTRIHGVPANVVDVTGAGDTFCSSFTFMFEQSGDIQLSATFATYASSLAITKMGARSGAVGLIPVLEYMKQHGEDTSVYDKYLCTL